MINQFVKYASVVSVGICLLSGCIEHKTEAVIKFKDEHEKKFIEKEENIDYKGYKIFEGKIPCETCDGISQRLVLKGDTVGIYRLTEIYDKAGNEVDPTLISTGQWRNETQNSKKILVLSQGKMNDSIRRMEYELRPNMLVQISLDEELIANKNAYHLKLVKKSIK